MIREIKFRAWDDNKKVMLEDVAVYSGGHGGVEYDTALSAYGSEGNLPEEQGDEWVFLMNHIFLQFTGKKDVKGVDIYEGDVMRSHHFKTGKKQYYLYHKVMWDDDHCCWKVVALKNAQGDSLNVNGNPQLFVYLRNTGNTHEVVGNIYKDKKYNSEQKSQPVSQH